MEIRQIGGILVTCMTSVNISIELFIHFRALIAKQFRNCQKQHFTSLNRRQISPRPAKTKKTPHQLQSTRKKLGQSLTATS